MFKVVTDLIRAGSCLRILLQVGTTLYVDLPVTIHQVSHERPAKSNMKTLTKMVHYIVLGLLYTLAPPLNTPAMLTRLSAWTNINGILKNRFPTETTSAMFGLTTSIFIAGLISYLFALTVFSLSLVTTDATPLTLNLVNAGTVPYNLWASVL